MNVAKRDASYATTLAFLERSLVNADEARTNTKQLAPTEQELHVLRSELLHGNIVIVDSSVDHVSLLLL